MQFGNIGILLDTRTMIICFSHINTVKTINNYIRMKKTSDSRAVSLVCIRLTKVYILNIIFLLKLNSSIRNKIRFFFFT